MKTRKSMLKKLVNRFVGIVKVADSENTNKLILNPIYQNDDDRQLFI